MERYLPLALAILFMNPALQAQTTTEGFENGYADGATQFNGPGGEVFQLTSDFRIVYYPPYGNDGSAYFIDTGALEGNTNTPPSRIVLANADKTFELRKVHVWTSSDDGASYATGTVTFAGTGPSGAVSQSFLIEPTGNTGQDWDVVDLSGSSFDGTPLQQVTVTYSAGLDYVALDDIEYTLADLVGIQGTDRPPMITLYPTPVLDVLHIDLTTFSGPTDFAIFNGVGQVVEAGTLAGGRERSLNVANLTEGLYLLQLARGNGRPVVLRFSRMGR